MTNPTNTKKLSPIRTFADDLEIVRGTKKNSVLPPETNKVTEPKASIKKTTSEIKKEPQPITSTALTVTPNKSELALPKDVAQPEVKQPFHKFKPTAAISPIVKNNTEKIVTPIVPKIVEENTTPKIVNNPIKKIVTGPLGISEASREANPAVIITDTKRNRFNLLNAIKEAVTAWFVNHKKTALEKKKPKYTVPQAEIRKGVIQKATAKTAKTNTADHLAVVNRIKEINQANVPKATPLIQAVENNRIQSPRLELRHTTKPEVTDTFEYEEETPVWESDLETKVHSEVEKKDPELFKAFKKVSTLPADELIKELEQTPVPVPKESVKIVPVIPFVKETREPVVIPETIVNNISEVEKVAPAIVPDQIIFPKILPDLPNPTNIKPELIIPIQKIEPVPETVLPQKEVDWKNVNRDISKLSNQFDKEIKSRSTSTPSFLLLLGRINKMAILGVLVVFFLILSGLILWPLYNTNTSEVTFIIDQNTQSNEATINPVSHVFNKQTVRDIVKEASSGDTSFASLIFTDEVTGVPIVDNTLFTIVDAKVLTDFKQTVTATEIGGYRGDPWLLFTISDLSTGIGGMFNWEKNISGDLSPWFGPAMYMSNNRQISNFTDQIVEKTDVRILKDTSGNEQIVYGFLSANKLLITTNTTAFLNIKNRLNGE